MRILLITRYFPPSVGIATERLLSWAKYLERAGHEVTILTTQKESTHTTKFRVIEVPYFDPISFFHLEKNKEQFATKNSWKGKLAKFYRSHLNERMPSRADPWIIPAIRQLRKMQREGERFDLIISSYGPPASHLIARTAKRLFSAKWVADFRDLWVDNHIYRGLFPFTLVERYLEKRVVREAGLITTVSEGLKKKLLERYPQAKVAVITNGFDPENFPKTVEKVKREKFRLVYTGTLYQGRNDLSSLFQALKGLQNLELYFYGTVHEEFFRLISHYGLEGIVHYGGVVSHPSALQLQQEADGLLLLDYLSAYDGVLTGKVFEYLYANPPLLAVGVKRGSELFSLLTKIEAGLVTGNDPVEIRQAIQELMRGEFPAKKREQIALYSREIQVKQLLSLIA